jgi:hypothetical protein
MYLCLSASALCCSTELHIRTAGSGAARSSWPPSRWLARMPGLHSYDGAAAGAESPPSHLSYSLRLIILFVNIDVSKHILVIDTSVLVKSNMERKEYLILHCVHCF